MTCFIIDDEQMSRLALERLCLKVKDLEVLAVCDSAEAALEHLQSESVDLLFLDIHLPGLSGMDLVRSFDPLPQVIFTTSDKEFALEAYDHDVTDYLVKPVTLPRLLKAVQRARQRLVAAHPNPAAPAAGEDDVFIKVDNRIVRLPLAEILWIEALGDYMRFHTADKRYTVHMTLKRLEEQLPPSQFLKVHRKYIVNISHIIDIQDNSILIRDELIPISRRNRETLMNRLNLLG
ncbi:MAG: DNA-binding response regulator [Bacteroidetes bacterium]|nr:MAG: DNA-binding response regulator [Bacteroidota bacterium]